MSNKSTERLLTKTQIDLSKLINSELIGTKRFETKRETIDYLRRLFLNYNDLLKRIDEIYDTIVHPQKRRILRFLLDALVGRLIELRNEMVRFDSCEYTYFEDLALDGNRTLVC